MKDKIINRIHTQKIGEGFLSLKPPNYKSIWEIIYYVCY